MCVQGGDGTFLELDTTAGATAFAVNLIAYKYAIQTKDSSGNIDGRKCGPYTDKIAECNALPGHTGSKWCEIDSSDGYCVTNCDQCEFSVVIEETSQGAEENDATTVAQAFNAGFKAGRTSVGTFTVQFHEEDSSDGLCRTSGRQCRKMFQGGQHYAYCASTNQCVSECEQCPGRNYKDSHFDECTAAPTEYGQGNWFENGAPVVLTYWMVVTVEPKEATTPNNNNDNNKTLSKVGKSNQEAIVGNPSYGHTRTRKDAVAICYWCSAPVKQIFISPPRCNINKSHAAHTQQRHMNINYIIVNSTMFVVIISKSTTNKIKRKKSCRMRQK
jgi:hypothetical protein